MPFMQDFRLLSRFIHTFLLIVLLASCDENPLDVDVSTIDVKQEWKRLDQDLQHYDYERYASYKDSLLSVYGNFYGLYIQRVLQLGHVQDPALIISLQEYMADPYVKEMYEAIDTTISSADFNEAGRQLDLAMRYYRYHFPEAFVPPVVTCATNFNYNIIAADSVLGIGLELYLGENHPLYKQMGFQQYRKRNTNIKLIPYDAARGWFLSEFQGHMQGDNLLSIMLEYGKVMYLMDACFVESPDHLKIGFTSEQLSWCRANEWHIWSYFLEKDVLYSNDGEIIRKFTGEGPFTSGFPAESPSQLGYWVGWQIIKSYMKNNPSTTLKQLMELNSPQIVLQQSAYKPETK